MPENNELVFCQHCGKPEYWGEMQWLSGWCVCRNCYKSIWEQEKHMFYTWADLDGYRPTQEDYERQEGIENGTI